MTSARFYINGRETFDYQFGKVGFTSKASYWDRAEDDCSRDGRFAYFTPVAEILQDAEVDAGLRFAGEVEGRVRTEFGWSLNSYVSFETAHWERR